MDKYSQEIYDQCLDRLTRVAPVMVVDFNGNILSGGWTTEKDITNQAGVIESKMLEAHCE